MQQSLFIDRNLGDVACWALALSKALSILIIVGAAIGVSHNPPTMHAIRCSEGAADH